MFFKGLGFILHHSIRKEEKYTFEIDYFDIIVIRIKSPTCSIKQKVSVIVEGKREDCDLRRLCDDQSWIVLPLKAVLLLVAVELPQTSSPLIRILNDLPACFPSGAHPDLSVSCLHASSVRVHISIRLRVRSSSFDYQTRRRSLFSPPCAASRIHSLPGVQGSALPTHAPSLLLRLIPDSSTDSQLFPSRSSSSITRLRTSSTGAPLPKARR